MRHAVAIPWQNQRLQDLPVLEDDTTQPALSRTAWHGSRRWAGLSPPPAHACLIYLPTFHSAFLQVPALPSRDWFPDFPSELILRLPLPPGSAYLPPPPPPPPSIPLPGNSATALPPHPYTHCRYDSYHHHRCLRSRVHFTLPAPQPNPPPPLSGTRGAADEHYAWVVQLDMGFVAPQGAAASPPPPPPTPRFTTRLADTTTVGV